MSCSHFDKIRFMTVMALIWIGTIPLPLQAFEARIEEIINDPTVQYRKTFQVDTTPEIWNRVLDNLYLMGRLWGVYRFSPAYEVTRTDSDLLVVDPTGIVGRVRQVGRTERSRSFYGQGQFNHWMLPSFFSADGVIFFEWTLDQDGLSSEARISMRGNNWISRAAMRLISGTLKHYINHRFTSNLEDTKTIIRDISLDPDKIRRGLKGPLRDDFDRAFPPGRI